SMRCSTDRAYSAISAPTGVGSTRRLSRSNSRTPSCCSSFAICALSAGWETKHRSAACRKFSVSESATRYSSWRIEGRSCIRRHSGVAGRDAPRGRGFPRGAPLSSGDLERGTESPAAVLVVDDDVVVRRLARRALRAAGWSVVEAATGREALAIAGADGARLCVVLLDLTLPDLTGAEVCGVLRELPDPPIVLLSSGVDPATVQHLLLDPGVRFVAKPWRMQDVVELVREAVERHG